VYYPVRHSSLPLAVWLLAPLVGCATTDALDDGAVSTGTSDDGTRPEGGQGEGAAPVTSNGGSGGETPICDPVESCGDGIDNDCNGSTDEGCECTPGDTQSCFSADPAIEGVGICTAGEVTCDDAGKWGAECVGEILPREEVCNGEDDDCNGDVDETFGSESCGQGDCAVTEDVCQGGVVVECEPLEPVDDVEDCDGADDDCDGQVDEGCTCTNGATQPCYTGPMGTAEIGVCSGGTQTCVGGQWSDCAGQVLPGNEACNAIDEDCDGNVSEGTCSSPNALSSCQSGNCVISSCTSGFSNCDASTTNGCETQHTGHSNTSPGEFLGSVDADAVYGVGCLFGGTCEGPVVVEQGTQGRFFTVEAFEESSCCAYVGMRFELVVPPGVDYDLHLSGNGCQVDPAWSSLGGPGADEVISVWCDDDCGGASNTFQVNVEVRYFSGSSCEPWTLNVKRGAC
jgi:hypothetical protein